MKRRTVSTLTTALMLVVLTAIPSHGVTGWLTRANITAKGAGDLTTGGGAIVTLHKPHAIRVGVATPKGVSKRVNVDWFAMCDTTEKEGMKRVTTKTDGSVTWITIYSGDTDLGRACLLMATAGMNNTAQLRTVVQYKMK